ncbi:Flp family type IVb pilin [Nocardioides sp. C4-1]|uniref:Flp family type IVb pilin n=1 Tax=Nocardioides sp. C4-1 TaxID=3151851 RepID=UPI0032653915
MSHLARVLLDARLARMNHRGASAVEYGLLIAGVAALIVVIVFFLGGQINDAFDGTGDCVESQGKTCE